MKELRQRTDEVSDLERSMSNMQWDMREAMGYERSQGYLQQSYQLACNNTEGNETRDKKLDDLIASLWA